MVPFTVLASIRNIVLTSVRTHEHDASAEDEELHGDDSIEGNIPKIKQHVCPYYVPLCRIC